MTKTHDESDRHADGVGRLDDPPAVFDGLHCPTCGRVVDDERLEDGRVALTCPGDDEHSYGRVVSVGYAADASAPDQPPQWRRGPE